MKKLLFLPLLSLIALMGVSLVPQTVSAQKGKFLRAENGIKNRYIVVLNKKFVDRFSTEPAIASEAGYLTAQFGGEVKELYSNALKGFVLEMSEDAAIALSRDERVAFVEQDAVVSAAASEPAASWGLDRIDQRSLPLNSQYTWGPDSSDVHAYIIDSGIRPTHADFGGRATADFDALTDGRNGIDCYGHGTHVAGTIGSATYGVAKNVRLHGVRVLPCDGAGLVSHLIMGIDWVTANRISPAVANISITVSGVSNAVDSAIQNSVNSGVTYVIAAGNYNQDACSYSPARAASGITVGALNSDDSKAGYSNFGPCVDVWAPGTSILSLSHTSDTGTRWMSGTSMASPHVAGIAALHLAANPNASPAAVLSSISGTSTTGSITGLDATSPNRTAYSWLNGAPPPVAGRVIIRKRTARTPETMGNDSFAYDAANLASPTFTLQPNNEFIDPNVLAFGAGNMVTVTEAAVPGWTLTSISCVETSGSGMPNVVNSTVDLVNRKANIVAEEGEQIDCTFTSEPLAPTAADASVTGRVLSPDGRGVRGVVVAIYDASTGTGRSVSTNSFGYFSFRNLATSRFYILSVNSNRKVTIRNNVRTFTLTQDLAGIEFRTSR